MPDARQGGGLRLPRTTIDERKAGAAVSWSIGKLGRSARRDRIEPAWQDSKEATDSASEFGANTVHVLAPTPDRGRSNYFVRHWRGELSLPVSYWVNGSLLGLALGLLIGAIHLIEQQSVASLRFVAVTALVVLAGSVLSSVWSMVGTWRSAGHHVSRGGAKGWAMTARIVIAFGVIGVFSNLITSVLPQMRVFALIAIGDDPIGRFRVSVSPDGHSVLVAGTLREGAAAKIVSVLDATPTARWLVLDSNGGRVLEAEQLAREVRARQLDTYVERLCVSACTYVFLAGRTRAASLNAQIGFHQPSFVGLNWAAQQSATRTMLDVYRDALLPEAFIQRIGQTPPSKMWYPGRDELLRANVVTRIMHSPAD